MWSEILSFLAIASVASAQAQCPSPGLTTVNGVPTSISCAPTTVKGFPGQFCYTLTLTTPTSSRTTLQTTTTRAGTTTTSAAAGTGGACGGNLNNCLTQIGSGVIGQTQCINDQGLACAANQFPTMAQRLSTSLGGKSYGYNIASNMIYALSQSTTTISANLNANANLKTASSTCSGLALGSLAIFDNTCLTTTAGTTTTSRAVTTTTRSTTAAATTTAPVGLQCRKDVTFCSGQSLSGLVNSQACGGLLNALSCTVTGILNSALDVCKSANTGCKSFGAMGQTIYTSPFTVAQLQANIALYKSQHGGVCTAGTTITLSDVGC